MVLQGFHAFMKTVTFVLILYHYRILIDLVRIMRSIEGPRICKFYKPERLQIAGNNWRIVSLKV